MMKHRFATAKVAHTAGQQSDRTAIEEKLQLSKEQQQELETKITGIQKQRDELLAVFKQNDVKLEAAMVPLRTGKKMAEAAAAPLAQTYNATQAKLTLAQQNVTSLQTELATVGDDADRQAELQQEIGVAQAKVTQVGRQLLAQLPGLKQANERIEEINKRGSPLERQQKAAQQDWRRKDTIHQRNIKQLGDQLKRRRIEAARIQRDLGNLKPFRVRLGDYVEFDFTKRGERILESIPF